jgi:hypothetical protein
MSPDEHEYHAMCDRLWAHLGLTGVQDDPCDVIVVKRLQAAERILAAVKSYPYLPQGLAQVIEEMEKAP